MTVLLDGFVELDPTLRKNISTLTQQRKQLKPAHI